MITAMNKGFVRPPRMNGDYPDRWLECQEALEDLFVALVEAEARPLVDLVAIAPQLVSAAVEAGWQDEEARTAVVEIAFNRQMLLAENAKTDRAIAAAIAARRLPN